MLRRVSRARTAQAEDNDERILRAAREVFTADPDAPIAAVAKRARVGIGALYRRYESKEALLASLCGEGLQRFIDAAEDAVAFEGDPWEGFETFMARLVEADTSALTIRLAGTFTPTAELWEAAERAAALQAEVFERVHDQVRCDAGDLPLLLEQLASVRLGSRTRTLALRRRYLRLLLDGLRAGDALPGEAPSWEELSARWRP